MWVKKDLNPEKFIYLMYSVESVYIFLLGIAAVISLLIKSLLKKTAWSPVPFYIIFGLIFRQLIDKFSLGSTAFFEIVKIFGDIGLILILFQVGVESRLRELLKQIKNAFVISIPEIVISGLTMFVSFYYLFNLPFPISLVLSIAFTATSIAISIAPWEETNLIKRGPGQLIVDLSAMDDIAGIILMVITFSLFSNLSGTSFDVDTNLLLPFLLIFLKLIFLMCLSYAFSVYIEPKLSQFIKHYEIGPDPVVTIISLALIFSALSAFLGLSIALGSFFIGLSFSRDVSAVRLVSSYQSLESFFIPFFFFSIGFSVTALGSVSFSAIVLLFISALLGKLIGVAVPSYLLHYKGPMALILGISMIPRAEVALVVIGYANNFFQVPSTIYSESILVVLLTCFTPLLLKPLLQSYIKNTSKTHLEHK